MKENTDPIQTTTDSQPLQTSDDMSNRSNRPSPSDSATDYPVGTVKRGNDSNLWKVIAASNGVQRWARVPIPSAVTITPTVPTPKFRVGDVVEIVKGGYGCHPDTIGTKVTITEVSDELIYNNYGYKIDRTDLKTNSNPSTNPPHPWILESSFSLVVLFNPVDISTLSEEQKLMSKSKRMAKSKNLNKRQAQDVRMIDTSLINKEEVFKMLALAESTGLPCLLVGAPGVNLK